MEIHKEVGEVRHSYWMVSLLVENSSQRDPLREHLELNGIETRPLFYPVHTMPMYSGKYQQHAIAEDLGWRGMNVPSYPGLNKEDVAEIAKHIKGFFP